MADVRAHSGVPTASTFGGVSTPSPSTPLVIDTTTGDVYALLGGVVTKVGNVVTSADALIAQRVFDRQTLPPAGPSLEDSGLHTSSRVFDRPVQPPQAAGVEDLQETLARRTFDRATGEAAAVLGDSADFLAAQVFGRKLMPAMWS